MRSIIYCLLAILFTCDVVRADLVATQPARFCGFGTFSQWLVFEFEGKRFQFPYQYSDISLLTRRMDANGIGYGAWVDSRDFTPVLDRGKRIRAKWTDQLGVGIVHQDPLDIVLERFKSSAFSKRSTPVEDRRVWEEAQPNGLTLLVSNMPAVGDQIVYFRRNDEGTVTDIFLCPSSSWKPVTPRGKPLCMMISEDVVGFWTNFDASRLNEWGRIRNGLVELINCALKPVGLRP